MTIIIAMAYKKHFCSIVSTELDSGGPCKLVYITYSLADVSHGSSTVLEGEAAGKNPPSVDSVPKPPLLIMIQFDMPFCLDASDCSSMGIGPSNKRENQTDNGLQECMCFTAGSTMKMGVF